LTLYRNTTIDGLNVFYREAGSKDAPTIVLLHGFPSSSHMYRDLIPQLEDRFHLIAPDYIGFGYSAAPLPSIQKDLAAIRTAAMKGVELNKRLFGAAEDCRREVGTSPSIVQSTSQPRSDR